MFTPGGGGGPAPSLDPATEWPILPLSLPRGGGYPPAGVGFHPLGQRRGLRRLRLALALERLRGSPSHPLTLRLAQRRAAGVC